MEGQGERARDYEEVLQRWVDGRVDLIRYAVALAQLGPDWAGISLREPWSREPRFALALRERLMATAAPLAMQFMEQGEALLAAGVSGAAATAPLSAWLRNRVDPLLREWLVAEGERVFAEHLGPGVSPDMVSGIIAAAHQVLAR